MVSDTKLNEIPWLCYGQSRHSAGESRQGDFPGQSALKQQICTPGVQARTTKFMRILFNVMPQVYLLDDCKTKRTRSSRPFEYVKDYGPVAIVKQSS